MKCSNCKKKIGWLGKKFQSKCVDEMGGDGKHNTIKGKKYCKECYWNSDRIKTLRESPSEDLWGCLAKGEI